MNDEREVQRLALDILRKLVNYRPPLTPGKHLFVRRTINYVYDLIEAADQEEAARIAEGRDVDIWEGESKTEIVQVPDDVDVAEYAADLLAFINLLREG